MTTDMPLVTLEGVWYTHPAGERPALRDVRMAIRPGERVAILGPNGAGKTSIRHVDPTAVGMVVQDPDDQLFGATAREDVAFGPLNLGLADAEVETRITSALQRAGVEHLADRVLSRLSVGERRRVAIAGILALEPALLLCDEPTAGLDHASREQLRCVLDRAADRDAAVVLTTHDVDFAWEWAGRAVVLHDGAIVADGPTGDVLSDARGLSAAGLAAPLAWRAAACLGRAGWSVEPRRIRSIEALERAIENGAPPHTSAREKTS